MIDIINITSHRSYRKNPRFPLSAIKLGCIPFDKIRSKT